MNQDGEKRYPVFASGFGAPEGNGTSSATGALSYSHVEVHSSPVPHPCTRTQKLYVRDAGLRSPANDPKVSKQ